MTDNPTQKCRVSILSDADGKKSIITTDGIFKQSDREYIISYDTKENSATFSTDGEKAYWQRDGEFFADLVFEKGKTTEGSFGNMGLTGKTTIETHSIALKSRINLFTIDLKYTLHFDSGKQKMHVRICVKM